MLRIFRPSIEVPFEQDPSSRFVPWIIGAMIFLATLALTGATIVSSAIKHWDASFEDGFQVNIPPVDTDEYRFIDLDRERQRQVLEILRQTKGVDHTEIVSKTAVTLLPDHYQENEGFATTILVKVRNGYKIDIETVKTRISEEVPGATVVSQRQWRKDTRKIAKSLIAVSLTITALIGLAAIATIAFVSHTGLKVHRKIIEVLHLIGAHNDYIAKQFQAHALSLGLKGAQLGILMTVAAFASIYRFVGTIEIPYLNAGLLWHEIVCITMLTPVVAMLLTASSARLTVLASLNRHVTDKV